MPTVYEIKCDKCNGDVIEYTEPPKVQYQPISMQDYIKQQTSLHCIPAVHYYTHYSLVCTQCGHIERYHK